ncbi:alpha-L-fucosidase [Aporhodopirellula aestuarii]|uniref:alpha-L-fucosidase n=1 Tax=Aporhodopirellula aestuarii TaxID=2950107 RepID=A0ABT0U2H7_9BACT|nr:alpha-L-fucosidase [Aporhodopirellula aestuarii]MCM2371101.1 alpha-L-fucosidase [Aporhodopirellula aestuarii]
MHRLIRTLVLTVASLLPLFEASSTEPSIQDSPANSAPFETTWSSLQKYECPQWFRDAKFGIYTHWGPYSVPTYPGNTDWYSRNMYLPGNEARLFHEKTYGSLTQFGYKDFVPMFTAKKFDAEAWAEVFAQSGARFAGPVAEHADGFSMWPSERFPWNAGSMGPQRDIVGELQTAIRGRGMKFMTSFHHQWKWAWYPTGRPGSDAGDPRYASLYGPPTKQDTFQRSNAHLLRNELPADALPPESFADDWLAKVIEVVDRYEPDLLWFDNRMNVIPETHLRRMVSHFYNVSAASDREVVLTYKFHDLEPGTAVLDLERSRMPEIYPEPWLCDTSIAENSWSYSPTLEYYSTQRLLHDLIDIVSKNGCVLLNVAPHPDGTIPIEQQTRLREIGSWLKVNGEAIYATRPWRVFGEGPTQTVNGHLADLRFDGFSDKDIRFTTKGNVLYASVLGWPGEGETIMIESLGKNAPSTDGKPVGTITAVTMLGSNETLQHEQTDTHWSVVMPAKPVHAEAIVFKIRFAD